ncbi:endonuclease/exonuclease/phosphatase (EEP) superfamily protein YafD [Pseudonocardia hierapolitana]|uniref:Endonuclease/exonuclease/phosphatase (EEP) superfamily protein YafD n=1 Tax=Pseudonocardia hierapolitana TaxID=1128676 RepID=A0A561SJ47_9PSEU|nr:endonuclease/exonuclease/phosphatase (EEP) superfamily protein YafD [Pseudonocardia hierapolitana]
MRLGVAEIGFVGVGLLTVPDLLGIDRVTPLAQLVSFRPYVLVGVAALVVVLVGLSWRNRRLLLPAVALLVVLAVGVVMTVPRTRAEPSPVGGRPLTVLAVNVLDGAADVTALAELIRDERPDLGALIEVGPWYRDRLAPLVEPLGYRFVTATGTDSDGVTDVFGVSALVAAHLGDVTVTIDESRPFPSVGIAGGGLGAMRFVAYHAVAPRPGDVSQWSTDLGELTRYCAGGTPTIVAGDFNATLDHSRLREVTAGCSDAATQRGQGLAPTWPAWMPDWFGAQIDHVFVTPPIAAEEFAVRELAGSDHRAVLVRLRVPQ